MWVLSLRNPYIIIFPLVCTCNSLGSTKSDDSACNDKCCDDDGYCKCIDGYIGNNCETCDTGYYVSDVINGENVCSGKWIEIIFK